MVNKATLYGSLWRLRIESCTKKQDDKIAGCLAQRMQHDDDKPMLYAFVSFARISNGCYDLTWHADTGYKSDYSLV